MHLFFSTFYIILPPISFTLATMWRKYFEQWCLHSFLGPDFSAPGAPTMHTINLDNQGALFTHFIPFHIRAWIFNSQSHSAADLLWNKKYINILYLPAFVKVFSAALCMNGCFCCNGQWNQPLKIGPKRFYCSLRMQECSVSIAKIPVSIYWVCKFCNKVPPPFNSKPHQYK